METVGRTHLRALATADTEVQELVLRDRSRRANQPGTRRTPEGDVADRHKDYRGTEGAKKVAFDRVLLVSSDGDVKIGTPLLDGAKVEAEILDPRLAGPKVHSYKLRRRKASRRKVGHRQKYLQVRVTKIVA